MVALWKRGAEGMGGRIDQSHHTALLQLTLGHTLVKTHQSQQLLRIALVSLHSCRRSTSTFLPTRRPQRVVSSPCFLFLLFFHVRTLTETLCALAQWKNVPLNHVYEHFSSFALVFKAVMIKAMWGSASFPFSLRRKQKMINVKFRRVSLSGQKFKHAVHFCH